jgi:signal transduction histidine kinase
MAATTADTSFQLNGPATGINGRSESNDGLDNRRTMAAVRLGLAHFVHEVTNPLHMIYSTVGLLEQELPKANDRLDPLMQRAIPRLKSEVEQMIALVASLRTQMECIWSSNTMIDAIELPALIDRALQSENARLSGNAVLVQQDMPAQLPAIDGSEKLLHQALTNLIRNAADAMPRGGTLTISAHSTDESVRLTLADTGPGIPTNIDIFQPFATTKEHGMGLGLAITRHVIEAHRGTIHYHSAPGQGTTFTLDFPRAAPAAQPNGQGTASEEK